MAEVELRACEWARQTLSAPDHIDCTTAVVLKILDGKCKMAPAEQQIVITLYDAIKERPGRRFDAAVHRWIESARCGPSSETSQSIHLLRLQAEVQIPKQEMKGYKALLRSALFTDV